MLPDVPDRTDVVRFLPECVADRLDVVLKLAECCGGTAGCCVETGGCVADVPDRLDALEKFDWMLPPLYWWRYDEYNQLNNNNNYGLRKDDAKIPKLPSIPR